MMVALGLVISLSESIAEAWFGAIGSPKKDRSCAFEGQGFCEHSEDRMVKGMDQENFMASRRNIWGLSRCGLRNIASLAGSCHFRIKRQTFESFDILLN